MPNTPEIWLSGRTISANEPGSSAAPVVTQLAGGEILTVWASTNNTGAGDPAGLDIVGRFTNLAGEVSGPEVLMNQTLVADDESMPSVLALADGNYLLSYTQVSAGQTVLRVEVHFPSGDIFAVDTVDVMNEEYFYTDQAVAIWADKPGIFYIENSSITGLGYDQLMFRSYDLQALGFAPEMPLLANPSGGTVDFLDLDAATLNDGRAIAVASADRGASETEIRFELINTDGTRSGTHWVESTEGNGLYEFEPSVTALTNGGFVIAWLGDVGLATQIQFAVFDSTLTQQGGVKIIGEWIGSTPGIVTRPDLVQLPDGGFMILYSDRTNDQLRAQTYDAKGLEIGAPAVIAAISSQTQFDATPLKDGRVAVSFDDANGVQMVILDPRDASSTGHYLGSEATVGTVHDDVFTTSGTGTSYGWHGNDLITDGSPEMNIDAGIGHDTIRAAGFNAGQVFDGGAGIDTLVLFSGFTAGSAVEIGLQEGYTRNFENVIGGASNDRIWGTEGANHLRGMAGDDGLYARAGHDQLFGGGGCDDLHGEDGNDLLYGNQGDDTISGGTGVDTLLGGDGDDRLYGGESGDRIQGGNGNDTISAGLHSDFVNGNGGRDWISGYDGADSLLGGAGDDSIYGDRGRDSIEGNGGNDDLVGGTQDDTLHGGSGNDSLEGGRGHDVLTGGGGADRFIFFSNFDQMYFSGNIGQDIVTDFQNGSDILDFSHQNQMKGLDDFTANAAQVGADVVLTLKYGNQVTFQNVALAQFDESDFIF